MNRKKRTEVLIRGNVEIAKKIADEIESKYKVNMIEEPNDGLVMIKVRETARKEQFYLGEVLVTEAKAYVNGVLGLGIVAGDNEDLAKNLAIIDAAYNCNIEEISKFNDLLKVEEKEIIKAEEVESQRILQTKVDFSTMSI